GGAAIPDKRLVEISARRVERQVADPVIHQAEAELCTRIAHLGGLFDQRVDGLIPAGIHPNPIASDETERCRSAVVAGVRGLAVPLRGLEPVALDAGADLIKIAEPLLRA